MQTFLPEVDFRKTAQSLDRQRLGKQRVETLQIAKVVCGASDGWRNHPAVKMWMNFPQTLLEYQRAIIGEWLDRGYKDTCWEKTVDFIGGMKQSDSPWWLGNDDFHASHQSNLIRKMPEHYGNLWPGIPHDMEYRWPSNVSGVWL